MSSTLSATLLKAISKEAEKEKGSKSSTVKIGTVAIAVAPEHLGTITK